MSSRRSFILFHVAREPGNNIADSMSTVSSPVAPFASRDDGEVDLVDACTRKGSESYTPQPQPLVLFYCYDAHPGYDEESYTRKSEIRPPYRPADNHTEEQTEQHKQPQCNHSQ